MRSSRWHAHGNVYLVTEPCGLTAERVREHVGDADGILEVADDGQVVIWNPDGSQAEMSGNGTRIAARWLAERTGESVLTLHVGPRVVVARMLGGDEVEQELGEVRVGAPEVVDGVELIAVDVGNPHAVVLDDPAKLPVLGPRLETHERFPNRTNVQVARVDAPGEVTARVWERGVGETHRIGDERRRSRGGNAPRRRRGGRPLPRRRPARPPRGRPRLPARLRRPRGRVVTRSARRPGDRAATLRLPRVGGG